MKKDRQRKETGNKRRKGGVNTERMKERQENTGEIPCRKREGDIERKTEKKEEETGSVTLR